MMKFIHRLEKSKIFWSLLWISLGFFALRFPSLIEPRWYGDEGIYQVLGMAINNGSLLYSDIWDNKPPLLYFVYALFDGDQFSVRLFSLIVGLASVWLIFCLSQKLFAKIKISIITTTIFAFIFAIPYIEGNIANAENFMLLPIILGGLLIYKTRDEKHKNIKNLLLIGFLLSIAFLFKIVAIFDLAAFLVFLTVIYLPDDLSWSRIKSILNNEPGVVKKEVWLSTLLRDLYLIILGFITPILITVLYFALNNALMDFVRATFFGNVGYVGYGNKFIIPQGFLILKLVLLAIFVLFIAYKRNKFSKAAIFILIWLGFSVFNALFSQRPYTHYLLVLLPSFCLLIGLIVNEKVTQTKKFLLIILVIVLALIFSVFRLNNVKKTMLYYQNTLLFVSGKMDVTSYQAFFDGKTPRDYQLASFIKMHTNQKDKILIWGDSAQIYALSKTLPINKYTVAYHILQNKQSIKETQNDIDQKKPKYIIVLTESKSFPFRINSYVNKFAVDRAIIYERSF